MTPGTNRGCPRPPPGRLRSPRCGGALQAMGDDPVDMDTIGDARAGSRLAVRRALLRAQSCTRW